MLRRASGVFWACVGCVGWLLFAAACTNDFDALLRGEDTTTSSGTSGNPCEGVMVTDTKIPAGLSVPICGLPDGCLDCNAATSSCTFGCHLCGTTCDPAACTQDSCEAHCGPNTACDVSCSSTALSPQCKQHCTGCQGALHCASASGNCTNQCTEKANCDVECAGGGTCALTCDDSQCAQDCQNGSCTMQCTSSSTCSMACANGTTCSVACNSGSKCILDCSGTPNDCTLDCNGGTLLSCSNGRKVCGYDACPP